jgi:hypothetical protein
MKENEKELYWDLFFENLDVKDTTQKWQEQEWLLREFPRVRVLLDQLPMKRIENENQNSVCVQ